MPKLLHKRSTSYSLLIRDPHREAHQGVEMAIRIARGLFRLWIVLSVLWIGCVGAITWGQYVYYEDHSSLSSTFVICEKAKTNKECFNLLAAAGRNPFDAYDLKWGDTGWSLPGDVDVKFGGIAWEQLPVALALVPPAFVLVIGSAFVWAFRGFRSRI